MLNNRLNAAHTVRDAYLPLKHGAKALAAQATTCLAVMSEQRDKIGAKPGTGAQAMAAIARGIASLYEAEHTIASAHPELGQLIVDQGLARFYAFAPDETPSPSVTASADRRDGDADHLSLVA